MDSYAWARSRSLLSKLLPLPDQTSIDYKIVSERPKEDFGGKMRSNSRYLSALKDGGVWLS